MYTYCYVFSDTRAMREGFRNFPQALQKETTKWTLPTGDPRAARGFIILILLFSLVLSLPDELSSLAFEPSHIFRVD